MKDFTKELPKHENPHGVVEEETGNNGPFIFWFIIIICLGLLFLFRYEIGESVYEKTGYKFSWMEKHIEESYSDIGDPEPKAVEPKVNFKDGGNIGSTLNQSMDLIKEIEFRMMDGLVCRIKYGFMPVPDKHIMGMIRNNIRLYFSRVNTEDLYKNTTEHIIKIKKIIRSMHPDVVTLEFMSVYFPKDIEHMFRRQNESLLEIEYAKAKVVLSENQRKLQLSIHKSEMERLEMERKKKIYEAETKKMVDEVLDKRKVK
jgi:hypothetical protein